MSRPTVVIVGGGFAGLHAAKALRSADVDITIIDRRNFHLFQPLLYQVASAALNPSDIAYPIRTIFRSQDNVRNVILGEVTSVDVEERALRLADGSTVAYDYLMVATGATHSYFGNDAWALDAPGLKTIEDALDIRGRILRAFEQAEREPDRVEELLTFVIVGAGPTGVEMAGSVAEIAVHALGSDFRNIDPASARVLLVEGSSHVLPVYPQSLSAKARRQLQDLGVEVRTDALVTEIDDEGVALSSGERISARTVVWAAGVQASPLGALLPGERDRAGRVLVQPDLSVDGHPDVFVAGDLAAVFNDGEPVPGVAPAAMQQGRHVAEQVLADLGGRPRTAFRYRNKGSLATIGRARAVADLGRLRFSGAPAWFAWLAIHIVYLIGFRNRVFVVSQWAWQYVTFRRGARIITDAVRRGRR